MSIYLFYLIYIFIKIEALEIPLDYIFIFSIKRRVIYKVYYMATHLDQRISPKQIVLSSGITNLETNQLVNCQKKDQIIIQGNQASLRLKKDSFDNRITNIFQNFYQQPKVQRQTEENRITKNFRKTYTVDCERISEMKECSSTHPQTQIPVLFDRFKQQVAQNAEQILHSQCHSLKENNFTSNSKNKQKQIQNNNVIKIKQNDQQQLLFEQKNKKVVNNNEKKTELYRNGKENIKEDYLNTKELSKSQKKVGFSGRSNINNAFIDSEENIDKKCTMTSIKIDEKRVTVPKKSFVDKITKTCFKSIQSSLKIISQNTEYRMFKMPVSKGSRCHLMRKQVQITNKQIEQKEEWLFRRLEQLHHKNIMRVFNKQTVSRDNKTYLLIDMEYYPLNLAQYFQQNRKQQNSMKLQSKIILFQILKALHYIHSKNIFHRNVSPFSIFINQKLEVVLSNLAYIKSPVKDKLSEKNFYQCNQFIRPPEIILEPMNPFEAGGDMWSFGCVAAFMIQEKLPFLDVSDADMLLQMMKILGKPSQSYLKKLQFKGNKKFIFPQIPRFSFNQYFNSDDGELLNVLSGVFQFDARLRIKPIDLLMSSYFDELRQQQVISHLQNKYSIPDIFNFQQNNIENSLKTKIIPKWSRHYPDKQT